MYAYDPELPNGFQDADFLMREYEQESREAAADKRRGICRHNSQLGHNDPPFYTAEDIKGMLSRGDFPPSPLPSIAQNEIGKDKAICTDCGAILDDCFSG